MGRESNSDSMQASWKKSVLKAGKGLLNMLPVIIGVVLLVGLFKTFVSQEMIALLFKDNPVIDGVIGSFIGSILTGNAVTSYIIGHELIIKEVSLFAVTAFMVSWVTVGIIQLPAEMAALGKRFSLLRNGISFLLSFIVAGFVAIVIGATL
jgi:uncharacterized membrane protein YraQ (UPF0718 family)